MKSNISRAAVAVMFIVVTCRDNGGVHIVEGTTTQVTTGDDGHCTCQVVGQKESYGNHTRDHIYRSGSTLSASRQAVSITPGSLSIDLSQHGRIVNGDDAAADSWPWFVSIQTSGAFHFCGGSLVRRDIVVTAAHCVDSVTDPRTIRAVVGEHNLDDASSGVISGVAEVLVHPHYNSRTFENDIAMLRLSECLPRGTETIRLDGRSEEELFDDLEASGSSAAGLAAIIGLGRLSSDGPSPRILKEARQFVMRHSDCQAAFLNAPDPRHRVPIYEDEMICGSIEQPGGVGDGVGNVDTCQGDSGGPFVTRDPSTEGAYLLTGVTSWGFGCADTTPGVYARVSNYVGPNEWISRNLEHSECMTPPQPPPVPHQFSILCGETKRDDTATGINSGFHPSKEHHYTFRSDSGGLYSFSTCSKQTHYDTVLHIVSVADPTFAIETNDDAWGCGLGSRITTLLPAGDYKVVVEGYHSSTGRYSLKMRCLL